MVVGTTVFPDEIYARGVGASLDEMQAWAGVNVVMPFTHTLVARQYLPGGRPRVDELGRELPDVYVRTQPDLYPRPWMHGRDPGGLYSDRDILEELGEEATVRGMRVYARILEPYRITVAMPGFAEFAEVDVHGCPGENVCLLHPEYIAYWDAVVGDLIRTHPQLHGFKFGQERGGPLMAALSGATAGCFCPHCVAAASARGIAVEEARAGLTALAEFSRRIREGVRPEDGRFVTFLRLIGRHPAVLSWERMFTDKREDQRKRLFTLIKQINPRIQVGWHIDHGMSWDIVTRAFEGYADKCAYSDWLSVALYFDSMGRRSLDHFDRFFRDLLLGDLPEAEAYAAYLSLLGHAPHSQPSLATHRHRDTAFSAEYISKETRRAVLGVGGKVQIHARIGFDMPGYECAVEPAQVHAAVLAALHAGADGLWCGREWGELRQENIEAFGSAIRSWPNRS